MSWSQLTQGKGRVLSGCVFLCALCVPLAAMADIAVTSDVDWLKLSMGLFGGLAMFLFGMEQMSDGLKAAAGHTLKNVLARLTQNRFAGAMTGAFVTAVLNSSSVTTVLVVGFISAGFMSLQQSIGVIMGANIGSTFTAQIIAFNVTQYAMIMVAVGFYMLFTAKGEKLRNYGAMVMGLGLLFYGMGVMGDAMRPLQTFEPFIDLMTKMEKPLLGILVGAVFTGLVQSSAATTGIAIVMASEGLISLPAGIALAFGANIGTCVTALLSAIGKPVDAKRAALIHMMFNIGGVLIWVMFIPFLANMVVSISPTAPELSGTARMAAEVPRQIANAHTLFNVVNTLLFIGFTGAFARLAVWLLPDKPVIEHVIVKPKFLNYELIEVPSVALQQVRYELGHMGEIIIEMMSRLQTAWDANDRTALSEVAQLDDKVDVLQAALLQYLSGIRRQSLTDQQSLEFQSLMSAAVNMESLADVIESELVVLGKLVIDRKLHLTISSQGLFRELAEKITQGVRQAVKAIRDTDEIAAADVIALKDDIRQMADRLMAQQTLRIGETDARNIDLMRIEFDLLEKLRRIYTLTKRIAKDFVPEALVERD